MPLHTLERHTIATKYNRQFYTDRSPSDLPPLCETSGDFSPWLSIKACFQGTIHYLLEDGDTIAIDEGAYLILNHHHRYVTRQDGGDNLDRFSVFFQPNWVTDVLRNSQQSPDALLAEPFDGRIQAMQFFEHRYPHDPLVTPHLIQMQQHLKDDPDDAGWLEEKLRHLILAMLQTQTNIFYQIEQLPSARYSTRLEIYNRLHRARDFMHANLDQPITLTEIAQVAQFSTYHFLRSFKQVFGKTPHTYLGELRLERAQVLLIQTDRPITDICFDVGFQSLSSFINRFRRHCGVSPRMFRRQR